MQVWWLAAVVSVALASPRLAHADPKTQALVPGYDKEANACDVRAAGLDKVIAGAVEMAMALSKPDDDLEADLVKLEAARDTVHSYCDALAAMLQLLRADPGASSPQVGGELALDVARQTTAVRVGVA
jgi:hypothetical protein